MQNKICPQDALFPRKINLNVYHTRGNIFSKMKPLREREFYSTFFTYFHVQNNSLFIVYLHPIVNQLCSSILDKFSDSISSRTKRGMKKFDSVFSSYFFIRRRVISACTCYLAAPCIYLHLLHSTAIVYHKMVYKNYENLLSILLSTVLQRVLT